MKKFFIAFVLACISVASAFAGDIVFHAERKASITANVPLARYDHYPTGTGLAPTSGAPSLPGTQIWHITFDLPAGDYLMSTSGHTLIKHLYVAIPGLSDYGMAANCRVALFEAATTGALPTVGTVPDESLVIGLVGTNILNMSAHYAIINTNLQKQITGGAKRVELWCSATGDGPAAAYDGLGGLGYYNARNTHQFNVKVEKLP